MANHLPRFVKRFARETRGSMVIEILLSLPLLMWAVMATMIYFNGFYTRSINLKAAYTISDLLSREMEGPVTPSYIEGLDKVFDYLTDSPDSMGRIRVTMVYCKENCDPDDEGRELDIDWSRGTNGLADMTEAQLSEIYEEKIPLMPANERVIVVETQVLFRPRIEFGVPPMEMQAFVVTRPRFVPKLDWEDGNAGSS